MDQLFGLGEPTGALPATDDPRTQELESELTRYKWLLDCAILSDGKAIAGQRSLLTPSEDLLAQAAELAQETAKRLMPDSEIYSNAGEDSPAQGEWMNGLAIKLDGRPGAVSPLAREAAERLASAYAVQARLRFSRHWRTWVGSPPP